MIPTFDAVEFIRPMKRGLNSPFLAAGIERNTKIRKTLVVKSIAGYQDRPDAMIRELVALLLAQKLKIPAVSPALIQFPDGFDFAAADYDKHRSLILNSKGWSLATVHLGPGWHTWMNDKEPVQISSEILETGYCFDVFVQNSDRHSDNPNLLVKESELRLLDFDRAFDHLGLFKADNPWLDYLNLRLFRDHCLRAQLTKPKNEADFGKILWEAILGEELSNGSLMEDLVLAVKGYLQGSEDDLQKMENYLDGVVSEVEEFLRILGYLTFQ